MNFNINYCFEYCDQFNIFNLIKKINPNYKLYFNNKDKEFIVVNTAKNHQICLNFKSFNINILNILNFSKIENATKLFNFIDSENDKLLKKKEAEKTNLLNTKLSDLNYFNTRSSKFITKDIHKYIEE